LTTQCRNRKNAGAVVTGLMHIKHIVNYRVDFLMQKHKDLMQY